MGDVEFHPGHVQLIGDARSDLLLAKPFQKWHWPFTFHYVGEPTEFSVEEWQEYHLQPSKAYYAEGTIEVLKKFAA